MDWFLGHTKFIFFASLIVWGVSLIVEHRAKIRNYFGSVSTCLFIVLVAFGTYGFWRDLGFSPSSLLYGMLIAVIAGFIIIIERLTAVRRDILALHDTQQRLAAEFDTMFGPEVMRRQNVARPVIYMPDQK